jgi:hypothetical protein
LRQLSAFSRYTSDFFNYEAQEKRLPAKEEREAKKAKARWDAEQNLTARKKSDDAFRENLNG